MRGWPVLRLMENLRFTNAPTWLRAFDMMGELSVLKLARRENGKKRKRGESNCLGRFLCWRFSESSYNK